MSMPAVPSHRKRTNLQKWKKTRQRIRERDGNTCQLCHDQQRELHAHHIIPARRKHTLGEQDANLITLCLPCHGRADFDPSLLRNTAHGAEYPELVALAERYVTDERLIGHGGNRKLATEDVIDIRERLFRGDPGWFIAKLYGISESLVSRIKSNERRAAG